MTERQQQTGEAHSQELSRQSSMPTIERFLSGLTSPIRGSASRPVPQIDLTRDETQQAEEDFFPEEMTTARDEPPSEQRERSRSSSLKPNASETIIYTTGISKLTEKELKFQLFIRGVDVDDPEVGIETRPRGSRGGGKTPKQFYKEEVENMIADGRWQRRVEEELLKRISEFKRKTQSRGSSSSSK